MSWQGLEDDRFKKIIEDATDQFCQDLGMAFDEGHWVAKFYNRCDQLGHGINESVRLRGLAEDIIRLRLVRILLSEVSLGKEE